MLAKALSILAGLFGFGSIMSLVVAVVILVVCMGLGLGLQRTLAHTKAANSFRGVNEKREGDVVREIKGRGLWYGLGLGLALGFLILVVFMATGVLK